MFRQILVSMVKGFGIVAIFWFAFFGLFMGNVNVSKHDITDEVLFYQKFYSDNTFNIDEVMEFCNKNDYYYSYDSTVNQFSIRFGYREQKFSIERNKLKLAEKKEYLEDIFFLLKNPNSYEKVERNENGMVYEYKNITKEEIKNEEGKVEIKYSFLTNAIDKYDLIIIVSYIIASLLVSVAFLEFRKKPQPQ